MINARQQFGKKGEETAAGYLEKNGCTILEKNYRTRLGEIDLIAVEGNVILFVEVKTREKGGTYSPKEAVTPAKMRTLSRVAEFWLKSHKKLETKARFDVIAILSDGTTSRIEWVKNAFDTRSY